MRPVLFNIGPVPVHSYYLLWTAGLWIALFWTRSRAAGPYGVDREKLRIILIWSFTAMLLGARIGGYADNWSVYAADPKRLLNLLEGGMSSIPAALACGITGIAMCRKLGVEVWRLADAASVPTMVCIAVGRLGCFMNGCCCGKATDCPLGVLFPGKPALVHPTQLYYSFGAAVIALVLWALERKIGKGGRKTRAAFLWPVLMVLYGGERAFLDFLREGDRIGPLKLGQSLGMAVAVAGVVWLYRDICRRDHR